MYCSNSGKKQHKNIQKNNSYDYESYLFGIENSENNYKYYFFINNTCIGPFIPLWSSDNWIDIFKNKMIRENIDLIGPIIEIPPDSLGYLSMDKQIKSTCPNIPFIHTYMFGCTYLGLQIIMAEKCFEVVNNRVNEETKIHLVTHNERKITACILLKGLKIGCFLTKYKNNNC